MRRARPLLAASVVALGCLLFLGCGSAVSFDGGVRVPARTGEGASWSPDGRQIAIPNSRGILLRSVAGGGSRQLAAPPMRGGLTGILPGRIDWSQDGSELRYLTTAGPVKASGDWLTTVGTDGSGLHQVALGTVLYSATWSPREWPLVYATGPTGYDIDKGPIGPPAKLWALDSADSQPRPFLDLPGQEEQPSFSPDGGSVMFTLNRTERSATGLWLVESDGSRPRRIVSGLFNCDASWSPDGRWIAFSATTPKGDRRHHLYLVPASGGRYRRLSGDEVREGSPPAWSPDGHWIAYATYDGQIKRIRPGGGAPRTIADLSGQEVRDLMWSPDGRHLAYSADRIVEPD